MNTYPPARSVRGATSGSSTHAPHAALLIDFDNVTLGIRSDLTKELRTLLDSEIIRGKVAVQRAYADWRRYPQYIVPLSESSIDLIFAPAFGTNKKNATDIRLAVDAIELVFTRQEIGTFILLSGDSDFSSLVIKLKEYGKYVIGVGIRESASDLLIQNCDEYYSYSDLAGLTREADLPSIQRDPWELVVEAVETMARNDDVMRSDRLKQVMQQIDPNFDERNAGFNRFSKFVTEAANRGLIRITKLDNGQYEVEAGAKPLAKAPPPRPAVAPPKASPPPKAAVAQPKAAPPKPAAPAPAPAAADEDGRRGRRGRRGRGRDREVPREPRPSGAPLTLAEAFQLMQRALGELPAPVPHDKLRARMVALMGREDALLDAPRFSRFLRQANDAEIADVRKVGDELYEVTPHRIQLAKHLREEPGVQPADSATAESAPDVRPSPPAPAPGDDASETAAAAARARALRFRRGSRGPLRPTEVPLVGVVRMEEEGQASEPTAPKSSAPRRGRRSSKAAVREGQGTASAPGPEVAGKDAPASGRGRKRAKGAPAKAAVAGGEERKPRRKRSRAKPSGPSGE